MASGNIVVKVGGSLFDWPELGPRLRLGLCRLRGARVLLVPGGGPAADLVRKLDQVHALGDEVAHRLALHTMLCNGQFLANLVNAPLVGAEPSEWDQAWCQSPVLVLNALAFCTRDDQEHPKQTVPHSWDATSDTIAARVAEVAGAHRLVLLKSVTIPSGTSWAEAARYRWVDPLFPGMVDRAGLSVEAINFREQPL